MQMPVSVSVMHRWKYVWILTLIFILICILVQGAPLSTYPDSLMIVLMNREMKIKGSIEVVDIE